MYWFSSSAAEKERKINIQINQFIEKLEHLITLCPDVNIWVAFVRALHHWFMWCPGTIKITRHASLLQLHSCDTTLEKAKGQHGRHGSAIVILPVLSHIWCLTITQT